MSHDTSRLLSPAEEQIAELARRVGEQLDGAEPPPDDPVAEDAEARRVLAILARAGLLAHLIPPPAPSVRTVCAIRDELAYASGLADTMFVMQGLGSAAIASAGSEALKERHLPAVAAGKKIAAFALTEPQAGSDVASMSTTAVRSGDHYVLDGTKTYISNAGLADVYTLFARTGRAGSGRHGLSAFAVEAESDGLTVSQRLTVMAPHPIGTLALSGCRVPASSLIGAEGRGYDLALDVLERFRPTVGAAAAGLARRALHESVARSRQRTQFGKPLAELQAIRMKLADMAMWLDAAWLLVMRAASLLDAPDAKQGPSARAERRRASAMAKLYATEAAQRIVDEAVQIHGGLGVTRGQVVERLYREVRALRIYEGTSEIQRLVIARSLLKDSP